MFEGLDQTFLKSNNSWVECYNFVNWNDIASIDKLVKSTEALVQKYNNPNEKIKTNIYAVFEELLARYPLFYGYWKRYVAVKYQLDGLTPSIQVLDNALEAFPTSIELWVDKLNVCLANNMADVQLIRRQFERCEKVLGNHFLSHDIWDKHIEFESKQENWPKVYEIYKYILTLPLHQYAKYYSKCKEFLEYHPEFLTENSRFDVDTVFVHNQEMVNKVWKFESQIKQAFFNIPELPESELINWDNYLAFLIKEPRISDEFIICTFERCLIPCYKYEHFWEANINWTNEKFGFEKTLSLFQRATRALPSENKGFKLKYIQYLEKHLDPKDSLTTKYYMDSLWAFQLKWPHDTSSLSKYLKFYKKVHFPSSLEDDDKSILQQQNNYAQFLDETIKMYLDQKSQRNSSQLLSMLNDRNISLLVVELIKHTWLVLKNFVQCRKHFTHFGKLPELKSSVPFWLTYYKFEKTQKNVTKLRKFVDQLGSEIFLPTQAINDILSDFQSFFLTNSDYLEYEKSIYQDSLGYDPILHSNFKTNNPRWVPFSKIGKEWFKSEEYKSNGHPGLMIEKPQITNSIVESIASRAIEIAPLPTFRNLEKLNQKPKYDDFLTPDYLNK